MNQYPEVQKQVIVGLNQVKERLEKLNEIATSDDVVKSELYQIRSALKNTFSLWFRNDVISRDSLTYLNFRAVDASLWILHKGIESRQFFEIVDRSVQWETILGDSDYKTDTKNPVSYEDMIEYSIMPSLSFLITTAREMLFTPRF